MLVCVQRNLYDAEATWAGTPVICTGSYLEDFPPAMEALLPEVASENAAFTKPRAAGRGRGYGTAPVRMWNHRAAVDFDEVDHAALKSRWLAALEVSADYKNLAPALVSQLSRSMDSAMRLQDASRSEHWHLRDLDTNEYIQFNALGLRMEGDADLTLDNLFMRRISWSGSAVEDEWTYAPKDDMNPTDIMLFDHGIDSRRRGPWAAHRFDIVAPSDWTADDKWNDVTTKAIAEVQAWKQGNVITEAQRKRARDRENSLRWENERARAAEVAA